MRMLEEKWTAFAGSAKDPLQVTNVRAGEGSFRSFLNEIGEELAFTKNEFNLFIKRWPQQVYYSEFKRMFGLVKRITTEVRTNMEVVMDIWAETSGKGLVPLYYDSDQEPSFHTFLKHVMAKSNQEVLSEDTKALRILFDDQSSRCIKFESFEFFFTIRKWISESRAEIEWWFPPDSILSQSVVSIPEGVTVLRSVYQIASLRLDTQMSFLKGTRLRTKQGPSASLVHFLESFRDKTFVSVEELDAILEKSITSHLVRERASKCMAKMLLFYNEIIPVQREQCLRLATRLTNRRLKRSHLMGDRGGKKSHHSSSSSSKYQDDDEEMNRQKSFNNFVVREAFLGALFWNTKLNAENYDEHVQESLKTNNNSEPRIEDIALDLASRRYWNSYWNYCNQDVQTQTNSGNRRELNRNMIEHFETRYACIEADSNEMRESMKRDIRASIQEIQHGMGVSKGQDMFRQRIKLATRTNWSPGQRLAAQFYVKQMNETMRSTVGLDFRDANLLCKTYEAMNEKQQEEEEEEDSPIDSSSSMDDERQLRLAKKSSRKMITRNKKDLMSVHEAAMMLPPVHEINEHSRQRGKASFQWIGKGRTRRGFLVKSFLQVPQETKSSEEFVSHTTGILSGFTKKRKKKKKRSPKRANSGLISSRLIFRDLISEFKARFQSLSRKDADQKIVCDGRVITLISPSDFKNVLMYVLDISGQDAAKLYKRLFPVITFESETIKPFRFVGWGQLDVPRSSPLYRYGPPITLESFKYDLPQSESHEATLKSMNRACFALRERLIALEAKDLEIESEIKRETTIRDEKQREIESEKRELGRKKKGGGWLCF